MTIDVLLENLEAVRARGSGRWEARCPAHDDHRPSLSIHEGESGVLLRCRAGCAFKDITGALGLSQRDLFYDAELDPRARRKPRTKRWRFDWRRTAALLEDHALGLWLRARSVLDSAKGMNTSEWTDTDFDVGTNALCRAYADLHRSDFLEEVAFHLRLQGLRKEQERYAPRSRVA